MKKLYLKNSGIPVLFAVLFVSAFFTSCQKKEDGLRFMVFGDMPYHLPDDYERLDNVVRSLNQTDPEFTVFVGDLKAGSVPCSDEALQEMRDYFEKFTHPLIYTPGDNDWTDCHREKAGAYDPEERLVKLREIFFDGKQSLGTPAMPLITQNTYEGYEKFVENAIWEKEAITFATIHVIGSNNNLKLDSTANNEEFYERDAANLFWLEEAFDQAIANNSEGVVLFIHAALNYTNSESSGFRNFTQNLREQVINYQKPVLLVYGDHHRFQIDKPLRGNDGSVLKNFTSLMVFGDSDMHAVEVRVNKDYESLFEIRQHFVEGN